MTTRVKILAVYQWVSGLVGLTCFLIPMLKAPSTISAMNLVVVVLALVFSVLSIVAGTLLWKGKRSGVGLSFLIQAFQLPVLFIGGLRYQLVLLASLTLGLAERWQVILKYGLGAKITMQWGALPFEFAGINLLALLVLLLLPYATKRG